MSLCISLPKVSKFTFIGFSYIVGIFKNISLFIAVIVIFKAAPMAPTSNCICIFLALGSDFISIPNFTLPTGCTSPDNFKSAEYTPSFCTFSLNCFSPKSGIKSSMVFVNSFPIISRVLSTPSLLPDVPPPPCENAYTKPKTAITATTIPITLAFAAPNLFFMITPPKFRFSS